QRSHGGTDSGPTFTKRKSADLGGGPPRATLVEDTPSTLERKKHFTQTGGPDNERGRQQQGTRGGVRGGGGKELRAHRFFQEGDPTHINHRELLAAEYGLKAFAKELGWKNKSIRIKTDS